MLITEVQLEVNLVLTQKFSLKEFSAADTGGEGGGVGSVRNVRSVRKGPVAITGIQFE